MTTKRLAVLLFTSCILAIAACDRNAIEPAQNSEDLRTRELPAEVAVRDQLANEDNAPTPAPAMEARRDNQAEAARQPSTMQAEAAREPSANRAAGDTAQAAGDTAPARRAEADLGTVGDAKLDVSATFEEKADGVQVQVQVEDAKPGTHSVRIYDRESCDDLEEKPLGKPFASSNKQGDLGNITIGANGKGRLETKAFNTSLKDGDGASLVGKTIVVQEREADSPKASGDALACGVIRIETQLADKAGRMTDPIKR